MLAMIIMVSIMTMMMTMVMTMTINMMTTVTQGSTHVGDDHNGGNNRNDIYDDD